MNNSAAKNGLKPVRIIKLILTTILIGIIWLYRLLLAPFLSGGCRFHPTCSHYAEEAIRMRGPFEGTWLAIKRIARCHPWGEHGLDPAPRK